MKASVAITIIVCGTILIAVPYIHSTIAMQQLVGTMVALDKEVNLTADLPKHADTVCMLGGAAMIILGAVAGLRSDKQD
ncbi:MAG: hypothetical protein K9N52_10435 [Verrucomicrobia bacterium]|nr:hypothetical protein [Verrucomicrobiota bacterium]